MALGEVSEYLSVAVCRQLVATVLQLFTQPLEVVDLTVEDRTDCCTFVRDRRVTGDEVDDRQAVLRDDAATAVEMALGIGPAVALAGKLRLDRSTGRIRMAVDRS